jgi:hypothetical protein
MMNCCELLMDRFHLRRHPRITCYIRLPFLLSQGLRAETRETEMHLNCFEFLTFMELIETAMFKETAVEKLIEYIQALPEDDQRIIAQKISSRKKSGKSVSRKKPTKKMLDFLAYTQKLPARLPKNYKFDREEANER